MKQYQDFLPGASQVRSKMNLSVHLRTSAMKSFIDWRSELLFSCSRARKQNFSQPQNYEFLLYCMEWKLNNYKGNLNLLYKLEQQTSLSVSANLPLDGTNWASRLKSLPDEDIYLNFSTDKQWKLKQTKNEVVWRLAA